jgi:hypothetical protein
MLHNKIYKHNHNIEHKLPFNNNRKANELQRYVYKHIAYIFMVLNEIWNKTPYQLLTLTADSIPSAQLHVQEKRIQTSKCIQWK